jgi:thioredoxin reductase (NADPH)
MVENFPGHPEGITGLQLMDAMRRQASRFETEFISDDVVSVALDKSPFIINTQAESFTTRALIIATGAQVRRLGLLSEERLIGRGVSYCAVCDAAFFRNEEVAVVGGGGSALEDALTLTRFASKVTLIHRREQFRAEPIIIERALANEKIKVLRETVIRDILGTTDVEGLSLFNLQTKEESSLKVKALFIAIGHEPNTAIFSKWLQRDKEGYLLTAPNSTKTVIPGVFAAGDVQDPIFRQAITASASGTMAALEAERFLTAQE